MVIPDTNIIIDHLRLKKNSLFEKLLKKVNKNNLAISVITIQELFEGKSTRNLTEENLLLITISPLKILPYNYETAQLAGKIIRDAYRYIGFADAAIAATCILNEGKLFTLNKKDFHDIKGLTFFNLQ